MILQKSLQIKKNNVFKTLSRYYSISSSSSSSSSASNKLSNDLQHPILDKLKSKETIKIDDKQRNKKNSNENHLFKAKTQLMRDFIQDALYNPKSGYFTTKEVIIPENVQVKPLNSLANFKEYNNYLHDLYGQLEHAWLTPVELFKPYYSRAISRYIVEKYSQQQHPDTPLKIYEIGAGSGTNAVSILDFIKDNHPQIYENMEYTIIEISKLLAEKQVQRIKNKHPNVKININNTSVFNWTKTMEEQECFVVLTEVIDNLPHDKITHSFNGSFETVIHSTLENSLSKNQKHLIREELSKINDPVIIEYLEAEKIWSGKSDQDKSKLKQKLDNLLSMFKEDESVWVPTVCFKLFQILAKFFPRHHLVLADFDYIPSIVKGKNSPTVQHKQRVKDQTQVKYESIDLDDVTLEVGSCDIFFPYEWDQLYKMYCYTNKDRIGFDLANVKTFKHKDFIKQYGQQDLHLTETKSKYNPILEDYKNMSFLIS
ncbi:hypothetical protein CYY_007339 [Polysphondylium violaceum]|uniref:Protein arginine methyltransferase NDUFAF7 n=1 Tax=Polysphondylium violaceum TaxID=133409 RepID=A0A8J4UQY2_9MYCE|nr:hypothetical protein CYY_007339 [Polysphondylium violaceum]